MDDLYKIKIPAFEGPLDLLLHLIRDNKVDIYDIPISLITSQYLEYIEIIKELDLEIAGDFLVMAATLIYIKSRMLLPPDEETETEELIDPRLELVQRLLEYQAFKDAASILKDCEEDTLRFFGRDAVNPLEEKENNNELYLFDINLFDLLGAFKKILENVSEEIVTITRETLTVKDRMMFIAEMIENYESIRFGELFQDKISRVQLIITFIAFLELLRLGVIRAYQEKEFGNIWIINPLKSELPAIEKILD